MAALEAAGTYVTRSQNFQAERGSENTRGITRAQEIEIEDNQVFEKAGLQQKSFVVQGDDSILVEVEKVGGAYYLQANKDVSATWDAVVEALRGLDKCDVNLQDQENMCAYGLQYFRDTFMLARTRLCKVEGEQGNFLEINRLQGDGFVFADVFKKNLMEKVGDFVEDVDTAEPIPSENAKDSFLNYLDLTDEFSASKMIQHWLQTLKPNGGIKYDQTAIFETLSSLGWNCNEENNFNVLKDYSDYIVSPILEILRHEETNFVPTAYFGALCLDKFVTEKAIPEEVNTWSSVFMLVEAMEKFCTTNPDSESCFADLQVTQSREVLKLLVSILTKFAPNVTGEQPKNMPQKVEDVLALLSEKEHVDALRKVLTSEEEVQAAA